MFSPKDTAKREADAEPGASSSSSAPQQDAPAANPPFFGWGSPASGGWNFSDPRRKAPAQAPASQRSGGGRKANRLCMPRLCADATWMLCAADRSKLADTDSEMSSPIPSPAHSAWGEESGEDSPAVGSQASSLDVGMVRTPSSRTRGAAPPSPCRPRGVRRVRGRGGTTGAESAHAAVKTADREGARCGGCYSRSRRGSREGGASRGTDTAYATTMLTARRPLARRRPTWN